MDLCYYWLLMSYSYLTHVVHGFPREKNKTGEKNPGPPALLVRSLMASFSSLAFQPQRVLVKKTRVAKLAKLKKLKKLENTH